MAIELGGRQVQAPVRPADNPDGNEMFAVYASPAGHPFCADGPSARRVVSRTLGGYT